MRLWKCRLSLIDVKGTAAKYAENPRWIKDMGACHIEWLEFSPERHVCQFETELPPVERLRRVSRRWSRLTLLLDFEDETNRIKGLAKAKAGEVEHCEINY